MVTKAFIIGHDYGSFIYRVRIPLFETAGLNPGKETFLSSSIFDATSSYQPGNLNSLRVGDCVFVSFEDNRMGKPVIIGKLYSGHEDAPTDAVNASTISVSDRATLPADTTVGGMSVARIAQECQSAIGLLTGKVEKVEGSSLMTDEEHRKLGTVEEGAERNIRSGYSSTYIGSSSKTIQVTLSPSMPDTNYSVAVTSRDSSTTASFSVYDKSTSGFTIKVQFSGNIMGTASIDYIVVANT